MNMSNYFDLKQVWVNELVGDVWVFLFLGLIMIWLVSAKAKVPFQVASLLSIVWIGLAFTAVSTAEFTIIWAIVIMFAGFVFYYGVAKLLK
jgi:hypothetical protein